MQMIASKLASYTCSSNFLGGYGVRSKKSPPKRKRNKYNYVGLIPAALIN